MLEVEEPRPARTLFVREGCNADIPDLVELGRRFHAESPRAFMPYSEERVKRTAEYCIRHAFLMVFPEKSGVA